MQYTKEERLDIGKRVYQHELTYVDAAKEYNASTASIANWVKAYKATIGVPFKAKGSVHCDSYSLPNDEISRLKNLSKDELIDEVINYLRSILL